MMINSKTQRETGNRCGHDRQNLRKLRKGFSNQPQILIELAQRVAKFFTNRSSIPSLLRAKGSKRQRRSESAESICLVLQCIAKYIDLVTFKVGYTFKNVWRNLSYKDIAEQAGMSLDRVGDAMRELQRTGLIAVHQQYKEVYDQNGVKRRFAVIAVKTVNLAIFALFGLEKRCVKERAKAYKRQQKREHTEKMNNEAFHKASETGLKGAAMARATLQAAKYAARQNVKKKAKDIMPQFEVFDDCSDIPY